MNDSLLSRFGTARHPRREIARHRPDGMPDDLVVALGTLSEALEVVEHARGALYEFHRLSGHADLTLQDALGKLRAAGQRALADDIDVTLVGRDVIPGRWTFQLVEEYDAGYYAVFRAAEEHARVVTGMTDRHVYEAEMKISEQRR